MSSTNVEQAPGRRNGYTVGQARDSSIERGPAETETTRNLCGLGMTAINIDVFLSAAQMIG